MAGDEERLILLLEARITDYEKNLKKAAGTTEKSFDRAKRSSRSATRQMEQDMIRSTNRINQALASTSTQIGALGRTFVTGFAGGMFAGGLVGLQRGVRDLVSEMSKIADVSKMIGVGAEDLQRLRYGFETTGVAADQTDTAMRRFARRIGEAANGGGQLYEVLKANNVQLRNADGSMRSQIDLLRDYANLIQNAGSHQERLSLAFKAFDVAGASMVDALSNGADGLDLLMDKAEDAGGVIDEELIQRAGELDRKWSDSWRRFEIAAKSAILRVIPYLDQLDSRAERLFRNIPVVRLYDYLTGDGAAADGDPVQKLQARVDFLTQHIEALKAKGEDAIEAERQLAIARAALEEEVQRAMAGHGQGTIGPTTLPKITVMAGDKDDKRTASRNRAAEAALREAEAVQKLIDNLAHELSLVGQSDVEKAKANALRQAGAAATDKQRQQIEMLVEAIHEETEAHKAAQEAAEGRQRAFENLFQMAGDGLLSIADGSVKAEDAVKKLAVEIALAAAQAALLGSGPLAGLFGGLFNKAPILNAAGGFRGLIGYSSGTANTGGQRGQPRGIVHGQEAVIPLPSGGKVPVQIQGGAGGGAKTVSFNMQVSVSGSGDKDLMARMKKATEIQMTEALKAYDREVLPSRVNAIASDPYARG